MSHFTCLVVGPDHAAALQPFHEFECTGTVDQYVVDVDRTEEARAGFASATETRLRDTEGMLHDRFDEKGNWRPEFRRLPSPEETAKRLPFDRNEPVSFVPDGWSQIEVPAKEVTTFAEWAEGWYGWKAITDIAELDLDDAHKYGHILLDQNGDLIRAIDRTNPNKKWDWYQVGGRWSNRLLFKDGSRGDAGKVGDIDWDGMLLEKAEAAAAFFDKVTTALAGRHVESWEQVRQRKDAENRDWDWAREFYNNQPVLKDLIAAGAIDNWDGAEELSSVLAAADRQSYIDQQGRINSSFWAMLHEGRWNERGSMGWFGASSATPDSTADYSVKFWETIRALPASDTVTVVDCHI